MHSVTKPSGSIMHLLQSKGASPIRNMLGEKRVDVFSVVNDLVPCIRARK